MTTDRRPDLRDPEELRRVRARRRRERERIGAVRGRGGGIALILVLGVVVLALVGSAVLAGLTVLRPTVRTAVIAWAGENPSALEIPLVAELVAEELGPALTDPASADPRQVAFKVVGGDSAIDIAARLEREGLLLDARAFILLAVRTGVAGSLDAGDYVLRRNMTPEQLVGALLLAEEPAIDLRLREGLRLEQITALLQTLPLSLDPARFYELATTPPASLLASHPWLRLPEGASLEGYLYPDTYRILVDTSEEELLGILLDRFREVVGEARLAVPEERGLDFHGIVTLASLVEQEAAVDAERATIAGVYQARLVEGMLLQADPTVIYARDTVALAETPFERWREYVFWTPLDAPLADVEVPDELAGYQTYRNGGLIPGPISTPSVASIDAALSPDTSEGYLFFVAKGDGTGTHAFARTYAEHLDNLRKYGYL